MVLLWVVCGGGGGGEEKTIEQRPATNVDLYNTESLDTKLQHNYGSFHSDDGYHSDMGLLLNVSTLFNSGWEKKKRN